MIKVASIIFDTCEVFLHDKSIITTYRNLKIQDFKDIKERLNATSHEKYLSSLMGNIWLYHTL